MKLKIVETSLNLRIERGHERMEYILPKMVADKQLALLADVYCNVEFMECNNTKYLDSFKHAGYNIFSAVDDRQHRGVMYAVKKEYLVKEMASMQNPHMLHIRISKDSHYVDVITFRILVAGGDAADYMDRKEQWDRVMAYVDGLDDKGHLVLIGDWNNGVILDSYTEKDANRFFNYQMIEKALNQRDIKLYGMEGTSFRGDWKLDHIASGDNINVLYAKYSEEFPIETSIIGVPDHKLIIAELEYM